MNRDTFIQIPQNVTDEHQLRQFLSTLVEKLDIAFGNRGDNAFASDKDVNSKLNSVGSEYNTLASSTATSLEGLREDINSLRDIYTFRDGSNLPQPVDSINIVNVAYLNSRIGNPIELPNTLDTTATLDDVISKINDLINALKSSKVIGG